MKLKDAPNLGDDDVIRDEYPLIAPLLPGRPLPALRQDF